MFNFKGTNSSHQRAFTDDNVNKKGSSSKGKTRRTRKQKETEASSSGMMNTMRVSINSMPTKYSRSFRKIEDIASFYTFGDVIGEGSFGQVRLVINKQNNKQYAIKIMERSCSKGETRENLLQNEIDILCDVTHPNILEIYELLKDDIHYFIVCEYIEGGQLFEYMQLKYH